MNVIFISPHFPLHVHNFCHRLKTLGANVLAIGDAPFDSLSEEVKRSVTEYYYLPSLSDYESVMRAAAFFIFKYGRIDFVESQNEYWLPLEARLREDFNIPGWKPKELDNIRRKSYMKQFYKKAGVKTARFHLISDEEGAVSFARKVGFPIIVKPDSGVGASDTYKITDEQTLKEMLPKLLPTDPLSPIYIMEEFVPGHIETFDGIVNEKGEILFFTGQVMAVTPLDMLNGAGENVSYTQPVEKIADLRRAGENTVKAFGLKSRFFHLEFFRLDEDKKGLGKKGDIIGLEANMRAPGGYILDKMNYAYDVDVYQIWAEMIMYGENRSFPDPRFHRYVTHFGRGGKASYLHTPEEIRNRFGSDILFENLPPASISGGMGSHIFLLKSSSKKNLDHQADFILAHKNE